MQVRLTVLPVAFALVLGAALFSACGGAEKSSPAPASSTSATPKAPLVHKTEVADWCPEHSVPESICTRCNTRLVPAFQAKNDWCKEHALPESQCFACHPELEAKFKAMAPKSSG